MVLLAAAAGIAIAARLGVWQLDRAERKETQQRNLDARSRLPALDAASLARSDGEAEGQHFRRVRLGGRWLAEHTVFLDNRQMDGKPGFFVVTPLAIAGRTEAVLVQRGWVARNFTDRAALPSVTTAAGMVEVGGRVAPPPARLFQFDTVASGPIRQNLDLPGLARESGLALLPLSILQDDDAGTAPDGLARRWPAPASDVQKHHGYAFQWFAIAVAIFLLYVWYRFIRPLTRRR